MCPGKKLPGFQPAIRTKFAGAGLSLQNCITHLPDILLIIMDFHGITQLLIHIDQLIGFYIGDVYHFIHFFKEFPYLQSGFSSLFFRKIRTNRKLIKIAQTESNHCQCEQVLESYPICVPKVKPHNAVWSCP